MPARCGLASATWAIEVALRGADVDDGLVVLERKLARDGHVRAVADAGHRFEETAQARRIGIERGERHPSILRAIRSAARRCGGRWSGGPRSRSGAGSPSPECRRCRRACACRGRSRFRACWNRRRPCAARKPSATSASRKSRAERGCRPRRPLSSASGSGCLASSVKTCISTALSRVLEAQKPRPTCMIWSGRRSFMAVVILIEFLWGRKLGELLR